jgi:hypothetical protein
MGRSSALLQINTVATLVIFTIVMGEIWVVATVIIATDVVDVNGS